MKRGNWGRFLVSAANPSILSAWEEIAMIHAVEIDGVVHASMLRDIPSASLSPGMVPTE
jgi:hypothetical protein